MNEVYDLGDSIILEENSYNGELPTAKDVIAALEEVIPAEDNELERRFDDLLYDKMRCVTRALPTYEERIMLHRAYGFMRKEYANMVSRHGLESLHGKVMSAGYGKGEDSPSAMHSDSAIQYCRDIMDKDLFHGPVFSVFFRAVRKDGEMLDGTFALIAKLPDPARGLLERMVA